MTSKVLTTIAPITILFAAVGLAATPAQASISLAAPVVVTGDSAANAINLTTLAANGGDWVIDEALAPSAGGTVNTDANGGGQISFIPPAGANGYSGAAVGFDYTDGTDPTSGSNVTTAQYDSTPGDSFDLTVTPTSPNGVLNLYLGGYYDAATLTVTSGTAVLTNDYTAGVGSYALDYQVNYSDLTNPITVSYAADAGQTGNITFQAASISPAASAAPEPSQVGMIALMGLALGGLLLKARKSSSAI